MTPRARFTLWSAAAVSVVVGQIVWLILIRGSHDDRRAALLVGGLVALELPLIGIAALLATTPADAIKLRRGVSEAAIVAGVAAIQLLALGLVTNYGLGFVGVVMATTVALLAILRCAGSSPWWATLLVWNPLLIYVMAS